MRKNKGLWLTESRSGSVGYLKQSRTSACGKILILADSMGGSMLGVISLSFFYLIARIGL